MIESVSQERAADEGTQSVSGAVSVTKSALLFTPSGHKEGATAVFLGESYIPG